MGLIVYADDVVLIAPCRAAAQKMLEICEQFSKQNQIQFSTDNDPTTNQRSQKLTPRVPKGNKTRGFKDKTSTQNLKSQYVSSAKQSKH